MKYKDLEKMISSMNKKDSFGTFIAKYFKNKYIEIYTGDDFDVVSVEQLSSPNRAVFCGKVIGAIQEFLVLDCFGTKPNNDISDGNIVFINTNMIISLKPLNPKTPMTNIFLKSGSKTQINLGK